MKKHILSAFALSLFSMSVLAASPPRKGPVPLSEPLNEVLENFTGMDAGHDFRKLLTAAHDLPAEKSEFETSAAWKQRYAAALSRPAYGSVRLDDLVMTTGLITGSKEGGPVYYRYDADQGFFKLCVRFGVVLGYPRAPGTPIPLEQSRVDLGSYVGANAFGARARITKYRNVTLQLVIPSMGYQNQCFDGVRMTGEEAKEIVAGALWGLAGHLQPPYLIEAQDTLAATIDSPTEVELRIANMPFEISQVVVFNGRTGQLYYRTSGRFTSPP